MAVTARQAPLLTAPANGAGGSRGDHFGANLAYYRALAGLSMRELADLTGTTQPTISRYEKGKQANPKRALVAAFCSVLGISYEQLMGPPARDLPPPATDRPGLFPRDGRILRHRGGADDPRGVAARLAQEASAERFVVQAIGDALAPTVQANDLLVMDLDREPHIGDIVVLDVQGELQLRTVIQTTGARLYVMSRRGELVVPSEGVALLGVVIDHTRRVPPQALEVDNPGHARRVGARRPLELALMGCDDDD